MHPAVFTIPPHRAFADALAAGLIALHGRAPAGLATGLVLVPNNRAARAMQDAFLRRSGGGLLLPRLVPVGDPELDERIGGTFEALDDDESIPPAIEPLERLMLLARLVQRHQGTDAAQALRLAEDLARTLDQLLIEEVDPARLAGFAADLPELSLHWQKSLDQLQLILTDWPEQLKARGRIDLADRRNRLLDTVARRWRDRPPAGFVCAAGITTVAPAVARLLQAVAGLPDGMVVLPALDLDMPEDEWKALGPHVHGDDIDSADRNRRRSIETHPQYHLKLLLDRMGVARGEVQLWRRGGGRDAPASRSRAIAHAMAPPAFTEKWQRLRPQDRRLSGVRLLELADPGRGSAGDRDCASRSAGRTRTDGGAGDARPRSGAARLGAFAPLGHRGGRQCRPAAVADPARHPVAGPRQCRGGALRAGGPADLAQPSAGDGR